MVPPPEYPIWNLQARDAEAAKRLAERLDSEPLGSKRKFWCVLEDSPLICLFKYGRTGTGEAWAEKIAAEIASIIELEAAKIELAVLDGEIGTLSPSFIMTDYDNETDQYRRLDVLVHGNEVLAGALPNYDRCKTFGHAQHSWGNIQAALERLIDPQRLLGQMQQFGGLLILDALIGNTDRHHENWAVLRGRQTEQGPRIAPSYDHASSLGRELLDERRAEILARGTMRQYVERAHGAIFWSEDTKRGPAPLELVRRVAQTNPGYLKPWLDKLRETKDDVLFTPVECVPGACMSEIQKRFCRAFLRYSLDQLRSLIP